MTRKQYIGPFRVERTHRGHYLLVHSYSQMELALRRKRRAAVRLANDLLKAVPREKWTWTDPGQAEFDSEARAEIEQVLQSTRRQVEWVRTDWLAEAAHSSSQ